MSAQQLLNYRDGDAVRAAVRDTDGVVVDVGRAASYLASDHAGTSVVDVNDLLSLESWRDLVDEVVSDPGALPEACLVGIDLSDGSGALAAPVRPSQVPAVGINTEGLVDSALSFLRELPSQAPFWWFKSPHAVVGPGEAIVHPGEFHTRRLIPEPELGIVIGRPLGPGVASPRASEAAAYVAGFTVCNDVSALDIEFERGGDPFAYNLSWSKSYPGFAPIGPAITLTSEIDPLTCPVEMTVNGEPIIASSAAAHLWSVWELIEYFGAVLPLVPGDLIMCGNHPPTKVIEPGDEVQITIGGIGTLRSPVTAMEQPTTFRVPDRAADFARAYHERQAAVG